MRVAGTGRKAAAGFARRVGIAIGMVAVTGPLGAPASRPRGQSLPRAVARRSVVILMAVAAVWVAGTEGTQDAAANGDTRTLTIYHAHTRESATVTYRRNGAYDERALEQLNWLLRDWRRDEPTRMDPRLFDTLWEVYRETGSEAAVHVVSAYRSPATNAMLRRRSRAVAEQSQHMLGKAMDFYLPDVPVDRIRAVGMRLQNGGVGYYPTAGNPFIHLDVGSVRAWPRMTRDQLARLFPDGRTVHVPADGRPLSGYEEARAEILARGGSVAGLQTVVAEAEAATGKRRGFWATLFGIDEDEDAQEIRASRAPAVAARTRPVALAAAGSTGGDESPTAVLMAYNDQQAPVRAARAAPASLPRMVPPAPPPEPAATALRASPTRGEGEAPAVARAPAAPSPRDPEEPAPAALRTASRADDPPPVRIAALSAPAEMPAASRLAWQSGAPGLAGAAHTLIPPLPPRRPDDIVVTGTLAAPRIQAASPPAATLGAGIPHPLPPPRPTLQPVQVAAVGSIAVARPAEPAPARGPSPQARAESAKDRTSPATRVSNAAVPSAPARAPAKPAPAAAKGAAPAAVTPAAGAKPARSGPAPVKAEDRPAGRISTAAAKPKPAAR